MYVLAKFQLHILKAFEVTALQSNSNRNIDLYSKHRKNKLQALTKMDVTYKWSEVGTRICARFSSSSCLSKKDDTQVLTVGFFLHHEQCG